MYVLAVACEGEWAQENPPAGRWDSLRAAGGSIRVAQRWLSVFMSGI